MTARRELGVELAALDPLDHGLARDAHALGHLGRRVPALAELQEQLLEEQDRHPRVTMQVFQKSESVLGGIDEAIAVLKLCSGRDEDGTWRDGWNAIDVHALHEGDEISPHETVMTVEGDYSLFAHL